MTIENCDKCEAYGFTCRKANWLERLTGREKVVVLNDTKQEFAHNFNIETCEVVTGKVKVKEYANLLMKSIQKQRLTQDIEDSIDHSSTGML